MSGAKELRVVKLPGGWIVCSDGDEDSALLPTFETVMAVIECALASDWHFANTPLRYADGPGNRAQKTVLPFKPRSVTESPE